MKTAVSIPDEVFGAADAAAERLGWSRSQLYARALTEFLDAHGDDVTEAIDALADEFHASTPNVGRSLISGGAWEW